MALNVDTVYKTVLLIMNKEQRGYITPDEFNKIATQVQLQIFENYFEDYTQQLRTPQNTSEYSERLKELDNKISIFKTTATGVQLTYTPPTGTVSGYFQGPTYTTPSMPSIQSPQTLVYKLGTVIYIPQTGNQIECQRLQKNDFLQVNKSPLTRPTPAFPQYLWENERIIIQPQSINNVNNVEISYIKRPLNVVWGYTQSNNAYIYNPVSSIWPELDSTEQVNFILKVLMYMGIVVNDPLIIQAATQESQKIEVNAKS
jgi:hypothetical protein